MMNFKKNTVLSAALLISLSSTVSARVVTEAENMSMGNDGAKECIAKAESGGDISAVNKQGFLGKFQVGEPKLIDTGWAVDQRSKTANFDNKNIVWSAKAKAAGINSVEDYLANESVQDQVKADIDNWNSDKFSSSAKGMIGTTIDCSKYGDGSTSTKITNSMLIQGAQFGHGKVNAWAENGGNCIDGAGSSTNDGNNQCVTWGMCHAANCSVIEKDMSKNTCTVTMQMINGISCSNYTGQALALCLQAKPHLMTNAECSSAEQMAQAAPKGPNAEKCENSSFGPGTGSWSYVLACSWASDAVADQDGSPNSTSPLVESDPECISKLRGMGVEFQELGQVNNGTSGGTTCTIDKAVKMKGTAVKFAGINLTLNCDMALATETFGQKLQALGVTDYYGISSTRTCGPMRDKNGDKPGTITNHAIGRAIDFSGVVIDGRKVSMGDIGKGDADGMIASQIKDIACSTFRGVLSPTYKGYSGSYFHNHVEHASGNFCR